MAENVTELDSKNFDSFLKGDSVVVDFWAPWCGPCKILAPEFDAAASELKDRVKFGKVNVDENSELAQKFGVMSIPTLIFFNDKKKVDSATGMVSKDKIIDKAKRLFKK